MRGRPSGGCDGNRVGRRDAEGRSGQTRVTAIGYRISLDAIKAEEYRKAKQKQGEVGLLALHETPPSHIMSKKFSSISGKIISSNRPIPPPSTNPMPSLSG